MNIREAYDRLSFILPNREFKIGVEVWKFELNRKDIEWSVYLPDTNDRFVAGDLETLMKLVINKLRPQLGDMNEVEESLRVI